MGNQEESIGFGYYVTIPIKVLLDEDLSPKARLLFGVIANLSNQRGYCFATNVYLSQVTGWHRDTISEFVVQLISKEYLLRFDEVAKNGLERRLFLAEGSKAVSPNGVRPNDLSGLGGMALHEYTNIILKENNTSTSSKEEVVVNNNQTEISIPNTKIKKKESKKKEKVGHPAYTELVKIWFDELHPTHRFNSEDGRAINGMIKNMTDYCQKKWDGDRIADVEYLKTFFKHFCTHLPEFYQSETLPTLNRKFYAIIEQITKGGGKKTTRPGSVSETQLWAASLQTTD